MNILRNIIFALLILNVPIQAIYVDEFQSYHRISNAKIGFCTGMIISGIGLWTQAITAKVPLPQCFKMPTLNELKTPSLIGILCLPCYFAFLGAIGRDLESFERSAYISLTITSTIAVLVTLCQRLGLVKYRTDAENLEKSQPEQLLEVKNDQTHSS